MNTPNPGPVEIDGYDQLEPIGRGGFSHVYRAHQIGFDRHVALKVLTFGLSDDNERRSFERECRAMGLVSQHPNIVTVFNSAFTTSGLPCIVMELYSAGTMADRLERGGQIPIETVLSTGVKVAGALHTAHQRGLLHRDIKPQNIFISEYGEPALGDFGISTIDDERTISGAGGLTVHYAPPEMLEGAPSDERSDVYSLAATLYTLLEGRRPFAAPDGRKQAVGELARRIILEDPAPISRPGIPRELEQALMGAMSKDPAERPATAAGLAQQLQAAERELGTSPTAVPIATAQLADDAASRAAALPPPDPAVAAGLGDAGRDAGDVPAAPVLDDATSGGLTITVGRSRRDATAAESDTGGDDEPSNRRVIVGAVVAVAAVLLVGGILWMVGRNDNSTSSADTAPPVTADGDDLLSRPRPEPPSGIQLNPLADGQVVVTWSPSDQAAKYRVTVTDRSGRERHEEVEDDDELILEETPADRPCVRIVAITGLGRFSDPSSTHCYQD